MAARKKNKVRAVKKKAVKAEAKRSATRSPTQTINAWLAKIARALASGDDGYWRDLVSFTWNIKTMEGRGDIEAMLKNTLAHVKPHNWKIEGEASQAGGLTEAWFTFETAVARGRGHLRLKDGKCWGLDFGTSKDPGSWEGELQHVEADAAGGAVVPRRQSAPVAALFAVPLPAAQGPQGGDCHAGPWSGAGAS